MKGDGGREGRKEGRRGGTRGKAVRLGKEGVKERGKEKRRIGEGKGERRV